MEELFRCGLVHSDGGKHRAESAELIRSIWELCKLGVKLDDLKSIAQRIEEQTDQELTEFRRALDHKRGSGADYASAVRLFKAVDQFVHWSRKDFLRMAFAKRAYRSRDLFVGPNQKHVFPSETLLAKMGLNREIDRLLNRLDQDSGDKQSLIDLARCYYLRSDWFNLYGVSEKILQIDPFSDRAIADMSRAMYYLGRVDDSVNLLEQRLKNSANPLLKFRLGQCLVLRAKDGSVGEFLSAVLQKQQLASEALREARDQPHIRRWILLDIALDNVCLADPLQLNQPAIEELERLHQEYQAISDKSLSTLSKMSLAMGKILAAYALYLVYRRHRHPKAEQLRRKVIQMDPYSVLAARSVKATPVTPRSNGRKNALKRVS